MKAFIKSACVIALALSLGACSKDDPKRDTVNGKDKPAKPSSVSNVEPGVVVTGGQPLPGRAGESSGYKPYEIVVTLPSLKDATVEEVFTLSVEKESIFISEAQPEGGSEILNLKQDDKEQELLRAQILDKDVVSLVVTRFNDEKLVEGKSYIFVLNENKEMELVQVVELNEGNSDETVVALIREFAEGLKVSSAEAILEMSKDEKNFHLIQVEDSKGNKGTYSRADVRFNKGK